LSTFYFLEAHCIDKCQLLTSKNKYNAVNPENTRLKRHRMKYKNTWVVVADGTRAQIYSSKGPGTGLETVLPQAQVADNRPSGEIASDRPGRVFDIAGEGRHAVQPPTDPHRHLQKIFAGEITGVLDRQLKNSAFDQLVVIAAPKMLGDLRAAFGENIRKLVIAELDKDLSKLTIHELAVRMEKMIRI
jgi:protein required for attachment to host cells